MARLVLIFLGPPGSGKGTQSDFLAEKLAWPVISTGELLRWHLHHQTALGKRAKKYMDTGKLVPDKLVEDLVAHRLSKPDTRRGLIFDGFPRDGRQLLALLGMLKKTDQVYVVEIQVSDKEVLNRLVGRRVCDCGASYHLVYKPPQKAGICDLCGKRLYLREDDRPAVIRERLRSYKLASKPLLTYAEDNAKLLAFDGHQPIKTVKSQIWQAVKKLVK
jgi:adenylate kinase